MHNQVSNARQTNSLLMGIQEGMPVYDLNDEKIGSVKYVKFPDDTVEEAEPPIVDDKVRHAHPVVRTRLMKHGYVRVGTGALHKDVFVLADQVETVGDSGVFLNAFRQELTAL